MADIFQEVDEDVRKERYDKLWAKFGKYIVGGALAIVIATAANVGWNKYQTAQREAEGEGFSAALALAREGKSAEAANAFARLAGEAGTGYRILAEFQAAAALKQTGDVNGAVATYDRIAADGGIDPLLRDLARLYAAQNLIDEASADELNRRLEPLMGETGPWRYSAREVAALVALKSGEVAKAREGFKALVDDSDAPNGVRARAAEMLAALRSAG